MPNIILIFCLQYLGEEVKGEEVVLTPDVAVVEVVNT